MPPASSPYSALLHHANLGEIAGEEPWLFRSVGWDWHWSSWGELARQAAAWAAGLPPASRAAFLYAPRPESVALDLAIQGAGLVSVPVSGEAMKGTYTWVEVEGEGGGVRFEASPPPLSREERGDSGGAVVVIGGAQVEVRAEELMGMAERVQAEIAPARRAGEREIVVLGGPLEQPAERAMLTWATVTGAAVALEPAPEMRIATAAWVRPTVFHGTAEEIAALRAWEEKGGRRRRLPFGRLRTVLVVDGELLGEKERAFWEGLGVRVADLPAQVPTS